jgi:hypothetical protein
MNRGKLRIIIRNRERAVIGVMQRTLCKAKILVVEDREARID